MIEHEERIAHLERTLDDLSGVVARQADEIARLTAQLRLLVEREATREDAGAVVLGDERPPHW